ncbi:Uncharacterised protein [Vibrio cholerae]|nr:Uncharacterised protein [Vibrio cholerae]
MRAPSQIDNASRANHVVRLLGHRQRAASVDQSLHLPVVGDTKSQFFPPAPKLAAHFAPIQDRQTPPPATCLALVAA